MNSQFNQLRTQAFTQFTDKKFIISNTHKTKMCNEFISTGRCRFGSTCHYAHTEAERRKAPCVFKSACKNKYTTCPYDHSEEVVLPDVNPAVEVNHHHEHIQDTFKTKMCQTLLTKGKCYYGTKCHYAHNEAELRKLPCKFRSACKNKNSCPFDHNERVPIVIPKIEKEIFIMYLNDPDEDYEEIYEEIYVTEEEEELIQNDLKKYKQHMDEQQLSALATLAI